MLVKLGVGIERLKRPVRRVLPEIDYVYRLQNEEAVITSTYEGDHSPGSLHYNDLAVDVRKPRNAITTVEAELKRRLGEAFDIVLEKDHFHIEYDPK